MAGSGGAGGYFLTQVFGDPVMAGLVSPDATVELWVEVEQALAAAEADAGILRPSDAQAIAALSSDVVDRSALWERTRTVGYPILPLVRALADQLPAGPAGRLHFGATTQDIMDTALAVQLGRVADRLDETLVQFGEHVAALVAAHRATVMPARTHGQQAVPTTFGATLSGLLGELGRQRERLGAARRRVAVVSLYGAGGTGAALDDRAREVRELLAGHLGLSVEPASWHAARDSVAELGWTCAALAASAARFATDVIHLSRNEIAEVAEAGGPEHYGASSTMPQKANPIRSEAVVGMAIVAGALAAALPRTMVVAHERAAGEWQAEWQVIPQLAELAAGALRNARDVAGTLIVDVERMRRNAEADGGFMLAEGYMIGLAGPLGREAAHDLVSGAVRHARRSRTGLVDSLRATVPADQAALVEELADRLTPDTYLGEALEMSDRAVAAWAASAGMTTDTERSPAWTS